MSEIIKNINKIKRITPFKESVIEWDIQGKNLEINITGDEIHIVSLLKLILRETKLYKFNYYRISPYKVIKLYYRKQNKNIFKIQFHDARYYYKYNQKDLITTTNGLSVNGQINIFIPDFLEICVLMRLLDKEENGYKLISSIETTRSVCEYIQKKTHLEYNFSKMIDKGYIIPERLY
jgi:hypothetical protein